MGDRDRLYQLEKQREELTEEIELLRFRLQNERWRAYPDESYCFLTMDGTILKRYDTKDDVSNWCYETGNYFKNDKDTNIYKQNKLTYQKLKDLALKLNDGRMIDWQTSLQNKYCITYTMNTLKLNKADYCHIHLGQVYCLDENFLEEAINLIGSDNLIQLFMKGV